MEAQTGIGTNPGFSPDLPHPAPDVAAASHAGSRYSAERLLPLVATALAAAYGNIYYGLWYPIVVALMTAVVGFLFLYETRSGADLDTEVVPGSAAARRRA